jgi:hypothetical protein
VQVVLLSDQLSTRNPSICVKVFARCLNFFLSMVAGANGKFSGGFDISAFPKMQEGGKCQMSI